MRTKTHVYKHWAGKVNKDGTMNKPIRIFVCSAREDDALLRELEKHLKLLQRQGLIELWHDREISPGANWQQEIAKYLNTADIILLLVSPDFINSDYCYGAEMQRAMERHEAEETRVIPIILRQVSWHSAPFGKIQALPTDGKSVKGADWQSQEEAFYDVAEGIRKVVEKLLTDAIHTARPFVRSPDYRGTNAASLPFSLNHYVQEEQIHQAEKEERILADRQRGETALVPPPRKARWSRRMVLLTGILLVGGGITWVAVSQGKSGTGGTPQAPTTPTHPAVIYRGHSRAVWGVSWSPDSMWVASASQDKTVQVWNASSGNSLLTYEGHSEAVWGVAWSPDGTRLASSSSDHLVQIWDTRDEGNLHFTYRGHSEAVWGVAWSPDGTRLASASGDHTVKIWDTSIADRLLLTYSGHSDGVWGVTWSPDGTRLASASGDQMVHVWDANVGGSPQLIYKGHSSAVYAVAWESSSSKRLASASEDGTVQIWDANVGGSPQLIYKGHSSTVHAVAWEPDGMRLASASNDKTVQVWNVNNVGQQMTHTGHSSRVNGVVWSPDGKRLASASEDGTVRVWEV